MSEENQDPELAALETALKGLIVVPAGIDCDRLIFQAGRASVAHRSWRWTLAPAVLAFFAGVGTTTWFLRPDGQTVEKHIYVPAESTSDVAVAGTGDADLLGLEGKDWQEEQSKYYELQKQIAERGLDGIPEPGAPPTIHLSPADQNE